MTTKQTLFDRGVTLLRIFCRQNELPVPDVRPIPLEDWHFGACAYYRPVYIEICLARCAHVGHVGRSWSYPGYTVDRTPFGVLQHELGHHVDATFSGLKHGYRGTYSVEVRAEAQEEPLTTYCPNDAEWFAEMMRLFITNPALLRALRPSTYAILLNRLKPVVKGTWEDVLAQAPERTLQAARTKVAKAQRPKRGDVGVVRGL